jgi:hypothetical protein
MIDITNMTEEQKAAKRVELAMDVLAQLEIGKIIPRFGSYITFPSGDPIPLENEACQTCAVGALAVACCGFPEREITTNAWALKQCLFPLFDGEQLALIETVFEGNISLLCSTFDVGSDMRNRFAKISEDISDDLEIPHSRFYENEDEVRTVGSYDHANARLVFTHIMRNIIKNNGKFVP